MKKLIGLALLGAVAWATYLVFKKIELRVFEVDDTEDDDNQNATEPAAEPGSAGPADFRGRL